jgi:hypothetical protein
VVKFGDGSFHQWGRETSARRGFVRFGGGRVVLCVWLGGVGGVGVGPHYNKTAHCSAKMSTSNNNNTTTAASLDAPPVVFLRVQYEVPDLADAGNPDQTITTKQSFFDASNCPAATIGLPPSIKPVKPNPGDYSYSGMHDHGPLPFPKEGGQLAQIIGFVDEAKKASDKYLTEVIEKEKAHAPPVKTEAMQHKRKRK